jgi:D-glycerate 3-kinase
VHSRVLEFCLSQLASRPARPLVIGLQAPQGAGKTTLVSKILTILPSHGLRGAAVSIDDFYLTRAGQLAVAAAHLGNPYLEHRGYPGTHDIDLGEETIDALKHAGAATRVRIPVYDKSAHGGRGDRAPATAWRDVDGPLDLVFVEGWMLGFETVDNDLVEDPHLRVANGQLPPYGRWHRQLDAFVVLRALDDRFVLRWRVEAEESMKARGLPGLSRDDIEDYVRRFLPAYALWAGRPPAAIDASSTLTIPIDAERRPA